MLQLLGSPVHVVLPLDGRRCLGLLLELTVLKLLFCLGQSPAGQNPAMEHASLHTPKERHASAVQIASNGLADTSVQAGRRHEVCLRAEVEQDWGGTGCKQGCEGETYLASFPSLAALRPNNPIMMPSALMLSQLLSGGL